MNKTTQILLNLVVGLMSFLFFVLVLFPLDSVVGHYLSQVEKETRGEYRILVSSIDASLIFDTHFENFYLYQKGKPVFYAPKIDVGISLFSLLSQSIDVDFTADYSTGSVDGRVLLSPEDSIYEIEVQKVPLKNLVWLKESLESLSPPVSLNGVLEGTVYLALTRDIKSSEGELSLKIFQSRTGPIPIVDLALEVPPLKLSSKKDPIVLEGNLEKGQLTVAQLKIPGPDLSFELNGTVRVNRNFSLYRASFEGRLGIAEDLQQKLPFLALIEAQKTADGYFPISLSGNLKSPRVQIGQMEVGQFLR